MLFLAFGICWGLGPVVIPALTRLKVGQTERVEGVQSHLKKAGTPTMGGLWQTNSDSLRRYAMLRYTACV